MAEQLSTAVRPDHYDVHWNIDFDAFAFSGNVNIAVTITGSVPVIRLHCEKLALHHCTVLLGGRPLMTTHAMHEDEVHISGAGGSSPFLPGDYALFIVFSGVLDDSLSGLYRSRYTDANGATAWCATTQFEAPYARKAFPCFDEPRFKATFSVSIDIPSDMVGISNMPVTSEDVSGSRKTVRFGRSPRMSTYLLYIGAGAFSFIEQTHGGRMYRAYGLGGKTPQLSFALSFAIKALAFFEEYTGIPYPLPKLDLIAVPDFAAGAMENWGAVTFREALLFCDESVTSFARKKRIADIISHELWHQWSGNLVTMQWWDDLWLNEAFATFISYKAVDHFHPDWNMWDAFVGGRTRGAFEMDMLSSTHPIAVPVETANQIEEIFDSISYGKGASVLRMIEAYIGNDAFRRGVSAYLNLFAYKNATAVDLWNILEGHSGKPVRDILSAWVTTPGFPLITVSQNGKTFTLKQERFGSGTTTAGTLWPVPLTYFRGSSSFSELMTGAEHVLPVSGDTIKCNVNQTGFYRVLYNKDQYRSFGDAIKSIRYSPHDRWGLLNDYWSAVFTGYASLSDLLQFMSHYENEVSRFVLDEIESVCALSALHLQLPDSGSALFSRFRMPFDHVYSRLGWESSATDSAEDRQLRPLALRFLVTAGDTAITRTALTLAKAYLDGTATVDPDLRSVLLRAAALTNDATMCDRMRCAHETKSGAEEKLALLGALADFSSPVLFGTFLDYALTDAVRKQDLRTVFSAAAANPSCGAMFFPWVKDNWERLSGLHESYFIFAGLLSSLITSAPDRATLADIRSFLDSNTKGFEKTKANSFEEAELILRFREREGKGV